MACWRLNITITEKLASEEHLTGAHTCPRHIASVSYDKYVEYGGIDVYKRLQRKLVLINANRSGLIYVASN